MARRMWLIGVGGSGAKTLMLAKHLLQQRLEANGMTEFPAGWSFLVIDLPPEVDNDRRIPASLLSSEYLGVAPDAKEYLDYDQGILQDASLLREFQSWRPDPTEVRVPPWLGAGQYRAIGRTVLLKSLPEVAEKIVNSHGVLQKADTREQMAEVNLALKQPNDTYLDPLLFVVGSIAGGTGSGTLLDVCDVVRASLSTKGWAKTLSAFAFLPSVFDALPEVLRVGVEANSYGAMAELLNAAWDDGGDLPHLRAAGMAARLTARGPAQTFMVGKGTGKLALDNEIQVYAAVAELLAELAVDDAFSNGFLQKTTGNFSSQYFVPKREVLKAARVMPAAALGFARFGLGRERFERYAVERLVRATIEHVVFAHETAAAQQRTDGKTTDLTRDEMVDIVTTDVLLESFVRMCGVHERSEANNQVLDQLMSGDTFQAELDTFTDELLINVESAERGDNKATFWLNKLRGAIQNQEDKFIADLESQISNNAAALTKVLPDALLTAIGKMLGEHGGWVTIELLDRLVQEVDFVLTELTTEKRTKTSEVDGAVDRAAEKAEKQKKDVRLRGPQFADIGIPLISERARGRVGAIMRDYAIALLADYRNSVLRPVLATLTTAMEELTQYTVKPEFRDMSSGPVPAHLVPSTTEVLLTRVEDYPAEFDRLIGVTTQTVGGNVAAAAVPLLLDDNKLPETSRDALRLFQIDSWKWAKGQVSPRLGMTLTLSASGLRQRTMAWLRRDPTSGVGAYLTASLESYLRSGNTTAEKEALIGNFSQKFNLALDLALPLLTQNVVVRDLEFSQGPGDSPMALAMTPLPLSVGAPGRAQAEEALRAHGVDDTQLANFFAVTSEVQSIAISTQSAPLHPFVFDDYRTPVVNKWLRSPDSFASWRRSRSRVEAVPLPRRVLRQLARGWYTACFLGLVDMEEDKTPPRGWAVRLLVESGWLPFPKRGPEGTAATPYDAFATLIDAYGLAELDAAEKRSATALAVYDELFALGTAERLETWVVEGRNDGRGQGVEGDEAAITDVLRWQMLVDDLRRQKEMLDRIVQEPLVGDGYVGAERDFAELMLEAVNELGDKVVPNFKPGDGSGGHGRVRFAR